MLLFFGVLAGGSGWLLMQPEEVIVPTHFAILIDSSDSMKKEQIENIVRALLQKGFNNFNFSKGSKIYIFTTGEIDEPRLIIAADIPVSERVIEGRGKIEKQKKKLITKSIDHFKATASETKRSPIYLAIHRVLTQLNAEGCNANNKCHLFIRSDGFETEERWLKKSIKSQKQIKKGIPDKLNNKGVNIRWCGLAETQGSAAKKSKKRARHKNAAGASPDFIINLWRTVFAEPQTIIFEPFCPTTEPSTAKVIK